MLKKDWLLVLPTILGIYQEIKVPLGTRGSHLQIPAAQEAEIGRIVVWNQPWPTVYETLFEKNPSQKRLVDWLKV
jgi:hypothetical protein